MASRPDLEALAERIRAIGTARGPHGRPATALGLPLLATLFPDIALPAGSLVELLAAADGSGCATLALLLAREACAGGRTAVVVDPRRRFYPRAAARLGLDLRRV